MCKFFSGTLSQHNARTRPTTLATVVLSAGSATYTTSSLTTTGTQAITASYGGDANRQASSSEISQEVNAVFVLSPDGSTTTLAVQSGKTVNTPINVTGATGFFRNDLVRLLWTAGECQCSFSPATVSVSGSSTVPTLLSVNTAANTSMSKLRRDDPGGFGSIAYGLGLVYLINLWPLRRKLNHFWATILCAAAFASLALTGCGGGSSGPKTGPGSYNFTVTASSGSVQVQSSYTLAVQ